MSVYEAINGLMEAFGSDSLGHTIQQIRDAVTLKESVLEASGSFNEIQYNLKAFETILRKAHD